MAHRVMREIRLLRLLRHPNIISLKEVMLPKDPTNFNELMIVTDYLDTDLFSLIRLNQNDGKLKKQHIQLFMY